jgi:hypothetical protein
VPAPRQPLPHPARLLLRRWQTARQTASGEKKTVLRLEVRK